MRISVDSNILLSAALFPNSKLAKRFELIAKSHELILPGIVLEEVAAVVSRKFPDSEPDVIDFIESLEYSKINRIFTQGESAAPSVRDEKDQAILEAVLLADVEYFITGDKDFLVLEISRPTVITIADFVNLS